MSLGKVTIKSTGQVIKVISPVLADWDQVDVLQNALIEVRKGNALAVGVFVKTKEASWADYCGQYDELASGVGNLSHRIHTAWHDTGKK